METQTVRVFVIGSDGTEVYAAHSVEEMAGWYRKLMGTDAEEDLNNYFQELTDIDSEFDFDDDGEKTKTSWRKLAEGRDLPCQLSTGYN